MSTATLRLHYHALHRKMAHVHGFLIPWKLLYILAGVCLLPLLAYYILSINQLTQGSYAVKNYQKQLNNLVTENRSLESHFAESSFLGTAQEKAHELSFQKTTKVTYIQILQPTLAEAK